MDIPKLMLLVIKFKCEVLLIYTLVNNRFYLGKKIPIPTSEVYKIRSNKPDSNPLEFITVKKMIKKKCTQVQDVEAMLVTEAREY